MKEKLNETSFETDIQQIYNGFKKNMLSLYFVKIALIYRSALNRTGQWKSTPWRFDNYPPMCAIFRNASLRHVVRCELPIQIIWNVAWLMIWLFGVQLKEGVNSGHCDFSNRNMTAMFLVTWLLIISFFTKNMSAMEVISEDRIFLGRHMQCVWAVPGHLHRESRGY